MVQHYILVIDENPGDYDDMRRQKRDIEWRYPAIKVRLLTGTDYGEKTYHCPICQRTYLDNTRHECYRKGEDWLPQVDTEGGDSNWIAERRI